MPHDIYFKAVVSAIAIIVQAWPAWSYDRSTHHPFAIFMRFVWTGLFAFLFVRLWIA